VSAHVFRWAEIAPVLVNLIGALAFGEEPSPHAQPYRSNTYVNPYTQARLVVRCVGSREIMSDERVREDGVEQNLSWVVVSVQVLCESDTELDDQQAILWLENARVRLGRNSSVEALDVVDVAIQDVSDVTQAQFSYAGRELDVKSFTISLSCALLDEDLSTVGQWIESVGMSGQIGAPPVPAFAETIT